MSKGKPNKRYAVEFKQQVVETMLNEKMSYIVDLLEEAAKELYIERIKL